MHALLCRFEEWIVESRSGVVWSFKGLKLPNTPNESNNLLPCNIGLHLFNIPNRNPMYLEDMSSIKLWGMFNIRGKRLTYHVSHISGPGLTSLQMLRTSLHNWLSSSKPSEVNWVAAQQLKLTYHCEENPPTSNMSVCLQTENSNLASKARWRL